MTGRASGGAEVYVSEGQIEAQRRSWADKFRPALELALDEFLTSGEWPERERFRRRLCYACQQGVLASPGDSL